MSDCLVAFGANISGPFGSPAETLSCALEEFSQENFLIKKKSRFYSSLAFPDPQKPAYLNGCVQIFTNCSSKGVLNGLKRIEKKMGRQQNYRWSSRICDLDLLSFENEVTPNIEVFTSWYKMPLENQILKKPDELLLPHPRIQDRAFVLKPLLEFAAGWTHPVLNMTVREMFDSLTELERASVTPI